MRKIAVSTSIVFLISFLVFFYWPESNLRKNAGRTLSQDLIILNNGQTVTGWVWDDEGGVIVGEKTSGEIFVLGSQEYKKILKKFNLQYLRQLI